MADDPQALHQELVAFLAAQLANKDLRQCTALVLFFAPGSGWRDDPIRTWDRKSNPEKFELGALDEVAKEILAVAEGDVNARQPGKHRYFVRSEQVSGRELHAFALSPAYNGSDDAALVPSGGPGGRQDTNAVLANHAGQLMRINGQMFEGIVRVATQSNQSLQKQNGELLEENSRLRRKVDELESTRLEREFRIHQASESMRVKGEGLKRLFQYGDLAMTYLTSGGKAADPDKALTKAVREFGESLNQQQGASLMQILTQEQMAKFMVIMNLVRAGQEEEKPAAAAGP